MCTVTNCWNKSVGWSIDAIVRPGRVYQDQAGVGHMTRQGIVRPEREYLDQTSVSKSGRYLKTRQGVSRSDRVC